MWALIFLVVWAVGLLGPTFGAMLWWKWSAGRWWMHFVFAPVLIGFEILVIWILFYASGDAGDGPPGLGLLVLPLFAVWILSLLSYYIAAGVKALRV